MSASEHQHSVSTTVSNSLLPCSSNRWFFSPGLIPQGSPLTRPWHYDCSIASHLDLSDPPPSCRQCPTPRLASTFECCVHSQLLTAAHVQRLRANVHFKPPSCRCQRLSLRCTSCELETSLSNCLVALDGFTRLDWHHVVSLWSASECAPAAIVIDQQFCPACDSASSLPLVQACTLHRG